MKIDIYNSVAADAARSFHSHQSSQSSSSSTSSPAILKRIQDDLYHDGASTMLDVQMPSAENSTPAIHFPEDEIRLSTLSYRRLVHESKDSASSFFQKACYAKQPEFATVAFFEIAAPNTTTSLKNVNVDDDDEQQLIVSKQAFIAIDEGIAFIESNWPVVQTNKESLATLLDLVEESGCENLIACVSKENPQWQVIVRSYLSIGFHLDNSMVIPGYILLSHEM